MSTIDFASPKTSGHTQKKKQCAKGYSCGNTCIAKGAQCRDTASGQVKNYADWMAKQAGGAIVKKAETADSGGGKSKPRSKIDQIDQKYASANPSDADADGWLKERLREQTSPEGLALVAMMTNHHAAPGGVAWNKVSERVKGIKDKESFIRATIEEEFATSKHGKYQEPRDVWASFSRYSREKRLKMMADLEDPKTSNEEKSKLKQKLDKDRQDSEKAAAETRSNFDRVPAERYKKLETEFDEAIAKHKTESQDLQAKIAKGDARTIQAETERMLRPFDGYQDGDRDATPITTLKRHQEIAKRRLIAASYTPPEQVLGVNPGASSDEIKSAYRKAAFKSHPDRGGSAAAFRKVNEAYDKLKQSVSFSEFLELSELQWDVCLALGALEFVEASQQFTEQFMNLEFSDRQSKEIEIIRTGTHTSSNGITVSFNRSDLEEIAATYDPSHFQAPLIISHDTKGMGDRQLAHSEFAYGAPKALKVVGDRLRAVFEKISPEFVQWVRDGKLLSVSSSIYLRGSPTNPTPGKLSLRHIAGLGKSPPAIKGMSPLSLSELTFDEPEEGLVTLSESIVTHDSGILLAEFDAERERRMDELEQRESALKEREVAFKAREGQVALREADLRKAEFSSFCEGLKGQLIPAIAPNEDVVAFMEFLSIGSPGELSFSEDKNHTPLDWFKGLLKRLPKQVEFGEKVKGELPDLEAIDLAAPKGYSFDPDAAAEHNKAVAYCKKQGWDSKDSAKYTAALQAVAEE